jgi:hypothetical protein
MSSRNRSKTEALCSSARCGAASQLEQAFKEFGFDLVKACAEPLTTSE